MITFKEAYKKVLEYPLDLGIEEVRLLQSLNRILAEDIFADRDFPPFDRATKDGIAIQHAALLKSRHGFRVEGDAAAGMPQQELRDLKNCLEVMTGAVVPKYCDTVIMYEHITIENGVAIINEDVAKGQNIHYQGSDEKKGTRILESGTKISPAEIGVMASVGKSKIRVKGLPKICTIATGNELVDIDTFPEPHQIRKSNGITLEAALSGIAIPSSSLHLPDDQTVIERELRKALVDNDVLLLSGGVSKGKFDYIPGVMKTLGVEQVFHRVAQRPGKPFWFGHHKAFRTVIFSFPGNPVSTFANYHLYFLPWLNTCWDIPVEENFARLAVDIQIPPPLTRFVQVKTKWDTDGLWAIPVLENGSGDLTSLAKADGFICLEPNANSYRKGDMVPFVKSR